MKSTSEITDTQSNRNCILSYGLEAPTTPSETTTRPFGTLCQTHQLLLLSNFFCKKTTMLLHSVNIFARHFTLTENPSFWSAICRGQERAGLRDIRNSCWCFPKPSVARRRIGTGVWTVPGRCRLSANYQHASQIETQTSTLLSKKKRSLEKNTVASAELKKPCRKKKNDTKTIHETPQTTTADETVLWTVSRRQMCVDRVQAARFGAGVVTETRPWFLQCCTAEGACENPPNCHPDTCARNQGQPPGGGGELTLWDARLIPCF